MSFSIGIIKNPVHVWDERRKCQVINWDESKGDRVLDFDFDFNDFEKLQNFLDIKLPPAKQRDSESFAEYDERIKNEYLEAAKEKGFEMLGRFWFWYDDAVYFSSEIIILREECFRVKNEAQNSELLIAMDKILTACNEALETNSGIHFGCD